MKFEEVDVKTIASRLIVNRFMRLLIFVFLKIEGSVLGTGIVILEP